MACTQLGDNSNIEEKRRSCADVVDFKRVRAATEGGEPSRRRSIWRTRGSAKTESETEGVVMDIAELPMINVATLDGGWSVLCAAQNDQELPEDMRPEKTGAGRDLQALLEEGGSVVIRVGVEPKTKRTSKVPQAMFKRLTPGAGFKLREASDADFIRAKGLFERATVASKTAHEVGTGEAAEEAKKVLANAKRVFEVAAEGRMREQVDRMEEVLDALRILVAADFGVVWVVLALERERDVDNYGNPVYFRNVAFRYVGGDEYGEGGAAANRATLGLSKVLEKAIPNLSVIASDVGPDADPRETLDDLYKKTFGFASVLLSKEKLAAANEAIEELSAFVKECKRLTELSKSGVSIDDVDDINGVVERANNLVTAFDKGEAELSACNGVSSTQAFHLKNFLEEVGGGVRSRKEKEAKKQQENDRQRVQEAARRQFEERQEGPEEGRHPTQGRFQLAEGAFDQMLPIFFEDALSRGKWICFRIEDNAMAEAAYRIIEVEPATQLQKEFAAWQGSLAALNDGKPVSLANIDGINPEDLRQAKIKFNTESCARLDAATAALQNVTQPQTLCLYRLRAPVRTREEVCRRELLCVDWVTTWAGATRDPRITMVDKARAMRTWLQQNNITKSDFLKDADPSSFPTYEQVMQWAGLRD